MHVREPWEAALTVPPGALEGRAGGEGATLAPLSARSGVVSLLRAPSSPSTASLQEGTYSGRRMEAGEFPAGRAQKGAPVGTLPAPAPKAQTLPLLPPPLPVYPQGLLLIPLPFFKQLY